MITSLPTCAPPRPPKKKRKPFPRRLCSVTRRKTRLFSFLDAPHPAQARPPHDLFSRSAVFSPAARHQREAPASNNRSPPGSSPGSAFSSAPPSAESPARLPDAALDCFRRPSHCPGSTRTSPRLGSAPLPTSSPRQPFLRPSFSAPPADKKSAAPASENSDQERRSLLTVTLR